MTTTLAIDLQKVLERHGRWLRGEMGGSRADLRGADLRGADLSGANLIWQIAQIHRGRVTRMGLTWDDMFNPDANTAVAVAIFNEQGWRPWSCKP